MVAENPKSFASALRELADDLDAGRIHNNCCGPFGNGEAVIDYEITDANDLWVSRENEKLIENNLLRKLLLDK